MTAVAKRLEYPKRVLYRHFPELCRAISAEYVKYMKESCIKRIEQFCEELKQAVRQVHTEGIYPSEAAISRLLAKPVQHGVNKPPIYNSQKAYRISILSFYFCLFTFAFSRWDVFAIKKFALPLKQREKKFI
ncbi:hypothetical protein [Nostoc sp.]|uniref:hypothetical protein n=1 Tax=Nostoc sp. TaxID=1180 RepID=UPI002FF7B2A3